MANTRLFTPIELREVRAKNRVMVSPMAQYAATCGFPSPWHSTHLGKLASGGAGIVCVETTKVELRGMGSVGDLGIWSDDHIGPLATLSNLIRSLGAVPAIQLAHAGRKAANLRPWEGFGPIDAASLPEGVQMWRGIAPTAMAPYEGWPVPVEMSLTDIQDVVNAWGEGARRAHEAGFDIIEIHGAHGYLVHQFLSPASNQRTDAYGGAFSNRVRFAVEIVESIRRHWPDGKPLFFRVSSEDDAGWSLDDSVELTRVLHSKGVDLIDCSSGGMTLRSPTAAIMSRRKGFQVPYAARIRRETGVPTAAVGLIVEARQAEAILEAGSADLIAVGRELLFNPNWPLHAACELGADPDFKQWPPQYGWWLNRRAKSGISA